MDRITSWIWKGGSKEDVKQEPVTSPKTEDNKELIVNSAKVDGDLNKSNNAQASVPESVKPILYDKSDKSLQVKLWHQLQKYTHLQPQDCLFCKFTATGCVTLLLVSGLSAYNVYYERRKLYVKAVNLHKLKTARSIAIFCMFGIWGSFLYGEWFNALCYPPGEKPRSFLQREAYRLKLLREAIAKNQTKENTIEKDNGS